MSQPIPGFIQSLAPLVSRYGYSAVGGMLLLEDFGIPVPGETVLITAAFYAGLGQLNIILVIIVGIVAAVVGDNIGYAIGAAGGRPLVERFGRYVFITPQRIDRTQDFFRRHGGKVVAIARFFDGLRQINGIVAGISRMKWQRFTFFNAIGGTIWVTFWSLIGYFGGSHVGTFLHFELYASVASVSAIVLYLIWRLVKKRRTA